MLPDGSCSSITLRPGASIREVLQVLCQSINVNIAAVDLFLVGGEKVSETNRCCIYRLYTDVVYLLPLVDV